MGRPSLGLRADEKITSEMGMRSTPVDGKAVGVHGPLGAKTYGGLARGGTRGDKMIAEGYAFDDPSRLNQVSNRQLISLSLSLSIYLSIYLPIHLSIYRSLFSPLVFCLFVCLAMLRQSATVILSISPDCVRSAACTI